MIYYQLHRYIWDFDNKVFFSFLCFRRISEPTLSEGDQQNMEIENADRSFFLQDLILSTLNDSDKESDSSSLGSEDDALGGIRWRDESPKEVLLQKLDSLNLKDKEGPA